MEQEAALWSACIGDGTRVPGALQEAVTPWARRATGEHPNPSPAVA